jgi:DNA-binding PadR family transcriptional regulator
MPFRSSDALLPLTPIAFEILLALLDEDLHGYAVLQQVEQRVGSSLPLRTGTLYRALARLLDTGLIEEIDAADRPARTVKTHEDDERRRYYRVTPLGRQIAKAEAQRLADQVAAARARKLLPGGRR